LIIKGSEWVDIILHIYALKRAVGHIQIKVSSLISNLSVCRIVSFLWCGILFFVMVLSVTDYALQALN